MEASLVGAAVVTAGLLALSSAVRTTDEELDELSQRYQGGVFDRWRRNKSGRIRRARLQRARATATHTQEQWERLVQLCHDRCVRCGTDEYPVVCDHVVPLYADGSDGIDNLQPLCARCNASKGPEQIDFVPQSIRQQFQVVTHGG